MADDRRVKLDIVFEGNASLSVTVSASVADELDAALADGGSSVFAFDAEDDRYALVTGKVVFVRRSGREPVVGFGAVK